MKRKIIVFIIAFIAFFNSYAQDLNFIYKLNKPSIDGLETFVKQTVYKIDKNYTLHKSKIKGSKQLFVFMPSDIPSEQISFPEHTDKAIVIDFWIKDPQTAKFNTLRAPKELLLKFWKDSFKPSLQNTVEMPEYSQRFFKTASFRYRISDIAGFQNKVLQLINIPF
jgi:hypothetical protein|tara:strand:+ start:129 stop:626 length:498 start_codon:yes stop_codon:yes gene_type:complete